MRDTTFAICERLAMVRRQHYGSRGKARFSRDLGIRPSTYTHYEIDRQPPADILLRAAKLTRTRLEWLITGEGEPFASPGNHSRTYSDELSEQLRSLLHANPQLVPQAEAFVEMLNRLPTRPPATPPAPPHASRTSVDSLIPIVGSTAAGTARYWRELPDSKDGPVADARLEELVAECTGQARETSGRFANSQAEGTVSLIQWSEPDQRGVLEFLSAPDFRARHPDCVAWRIDGDSMTPRYGDGDLVITGGQAPAENGHACVARQRGQLGVNCKLYREEGDTVWLIPVNADCPTQKLPKSEILWAWRVIGSVRLAGSGR